MSLLCQRLLVAVGVLAMPMLAWAAGGGDHGDEHHGMSTPVKLTVMTVNLAIFVYLLRSTAWPMMKEWVAARRDAVVGALEKAAAAQREAEALKQEWATRLANLDSEIAEMRAAAEKQIAIEREQILEATRTLTATIRRDAERAAEQELRNAQEQLRAEVAEQAYRIACATAPAQLGPDDQKRFVDEFVQQVSQ